jgi:transcriptional regulator with XRE-family HTH domain
MLSSINLKLSEKLRNRSYRNKFFRGQAQDEVAALLKAARKKRQITQPELEKISGMKQSAISRIEQASYARWNFQTLLKICESLDVRPRFSFEYAEDVIARYERIEQEVVRSRSPHIKRKHHRNSKPSYRPVPAMRIAGTDSEQLLGDVGNNKPELSLNQAPSGASISAPNFIPSTNENSIVGLIPAASEQRTYDRRIQYPQTY